MSLVDKVVRVLISLLIRSHYVYYLRAWHRLGSVHLSLPSPYASLFCAGYAFRVMWS